MGDKTLSLFYFEYIFWRLIIIVSILKKHKDMIRYYALRGIPLYEQQLIDTYSIFEWYDFVMQDKIKKIPKSLCTPENILRLFRNVVKNKFNYDTKEQICLITQKDLLDIKLYKHLTKAFGTKLYDILNKSYPEYNIMPWEMKCLSKNYFRDKKTIFKTLDMVLHEKNLTPAQVLELKPMQFLYESKIIQIVDGAFYRSAYELFVDYLNNKGLNISIHDFRIKPNGYWINRENADIQFTRYVNHIVSCGISIMQIGDYLNHSYIMSTKYGMILDCIYKHKHYNSLEDWFNHLFPHIKIKYDKKIYHKAKDGVILDSFQEKKVYEFLKYSIGLDIISTNRKKKFKLTNRKHGEGYIPDFLVLFTNDNEFLNKPIIIEFFGMFESNYHNDTYKEYYEKTARKNKFFRSIDGILYIPIFPKDVANNFYLLKKKIHRMTRDMKGGEN